MLESPLLDQSARGSWKLPMQFSYMRTSSAVSLLGDGLAVGAFPLLAHHLTSSAFLIGLAAAMPRIPSVFGLWLGQIADRHDPRRTMVLCDIVRGFLLGAFAVELLLHRPPIITLYAAAFILGTFSALFNAAAGMTIPAVVPTRQLAQANGQLQGLASAFEQFIGPPLGTGLYAVGRSIPFFGDAVSFFGSAVVLRRLEPIAMATSAKRAVWEEIKEGARFVFRNDVLRSGTAFIAVAAICQQAVFAIQVIYFKDLLGLSDRKFGLLLGFTAIGNILGNLVAERAVRRLGSSTSMIGAAFVAAGSYGALSFHIGMGLVTLIFVVEAIALGVGNVANIAIRQAATPAELRGRVVAFARSFIIGGAAVGSVLGGLLARAYGVRPTCAVAGAVALAAVVALGPALRRAFTAADLKIA